MSFKKIVILLIITFMLISVLPVSGYAQTVKFVSGDSGDAIKAIQVVLKEEGVYTGKIDGNYGSATVNAVIAYQKAKGLTQDGKCGANTLTKMGLVSNAQAVSKAVTTANARLRKGASTSHPEYYVMSKGTSLTIIGQSGDWYKVRTSDGIEGYAYGSYVKKESSSTSNGGSQTEAVYEGKVEGIVNHLNVRKGKGVDTAIVGELTNGTFVYVLEISGDWTQIRTKSGLEGYAYTRYIKVSQNKVEIENPTVEIPSYTLKRGMNNNSDVKKMQERLKELGYFSSNCTGNYGSVTYNAVKEFQQKNSLKADGIAGKATLTKLYSSSAVNKGDSVGGDGELLYELPNKPLKQGMDNNDVKIMQQRLKDLLYFEGSCTGYFGTKTLKAVKEFQKRNGLKADGIAGAKTLGVMYTAGAVTGQLSEDEKLKRQLENMIEHAKGYLGAKYVRGGNGPKSFDCSGLTTTVFREAMGYKMTRTAYTQGYNNFGRVIKNMSELKMGDLVFFNTNANDSDLCDHVGIYISDNQFIHASSSEGKVIISDISKRWWAEIFSWGKRVFE